MYVLDMYVPLLHLTLWHVITGEGTLHVCTGPERLLAPRARVARSHRCLYMVPVAPF
jgi:hypothetical protein